MSSIKLLANYINWQCDDLASQPQPSAADLREYCVEILNIMDVILYGSIERKVMVLLRTNMIPANAFLLHELCDEIRTKIVPCIFHHDASKRKSTVVLLNATILLLNRWYRIVLPKRRVRFEREMAALVVQLEKVRAELLSNSDDIRHSRFYVKFISAYRTEPIR